MTKILLSGNFPVEFRHGEMSCLSFSLQLTVPWKITEEKKWSGNMVLPSLPELSMALPTSHWWQMRCSYQTITQITSIFRINYLEEKCCLLFKLLRPNGKHFHPPLSFIFIILETHQGLFISYFCIKKKYRLAAILLCIAENKKEKKAFSFSPSYFCFSFSGKGDQAANKQKKIALLLGNGTTFPFPQASKHSIISFEFSFFKFLVLKFAFKNRGPSFLAPNEK